MIWIQDRHQRVLMGHPVMWLVVLERIGGEALILVSVPLILDDERAALFDIVQKPRSIVPQFMSNDISVGSNDHCIKAAEFQVTHLSIGDHVKCSAASPSTPSRGYATVKGGPSSTSSSTCSPRMARMRA